MNKNGKNYVDDPENWLDFRNAIVMQAIEDYKDSLKGKEIFLHRDPQWVIDDLESWFKSEDWITLTMGEIDGLRTIKVSRETACAEMRNTIELHKKSIDKKKKQITKLDEKLDEKKINKLNEQIWLLETQIMEYYKHLIMVQEMPEP